ncbi:hypothetical protein BT96DRAFT_956382 [Gymnopus androsaceus JB14]|uniref:DDE-1 domain-containing protein n=1 Tax=Gymnopus androsaceus JB14 TaxID=1447944 RepID=A0A6A4HZA6_9AGAR|nr:hypothetical protein BT96DRAFT_956382 [Gymnopus androsaceus JB14]
MQYWGHQAKVLKATCAAHKLPENWEDQCKQSVFCKAYKIKEYNIPAEPFINSDQTQMLYAPGDKLTWAETGSSQVLVLGAEEKHAFTVTVGITASGRALPFQAVYMRRTDHSCPSKQLPYYQAALDVGIQFVFSGTDTYWANHETMHPCMNKILVPYIEEQKQKLNLPKNQKTLWTINVWAVHCSKEFRSWMHKNHPNIILDYVPGGCTGVGQPCDVGMQHPFKLSTKQSYHEDVVQNFMKQIQDDKKGTGTLTVDNHIPTLQKGSV